MKSLAISIGLAVPIFVAIFWLGGELSEFKGWDLLFPILLGVLIGVLVWLKYAANEWIIRWGYRLKERREINKTKDDLQ